MPPGQPTHTVLPEAPCEKWKNSEQVRGRTKVFCAASVPAPAHHMDSNKCMTSTVGRGIIKGLRAPNFHKKLCTKLGRRKESVNYSNNLTISFMKAPYETWPDPTAPLEGPKLEHGAIGKDDNGSAYRYNDSSPNLLHHGNRKELYWHQSGSTTLFIWLWLMFCVFCVRTMHADWVQCITHVTSTSGWITEYIYRIPCQRIVEGVFFQNRSAFG